MFSELRSEDDPDDFESPTTETAATLPSQQQNQYVQMKEKNGGQLGRVSDANEAFNGRQIGSNGLELSSLRTSSNASSSSSSSRPSSNRSSGRNSADPDATELHGSLINSEHPSEAMKHGSSDDDHLSPHAAAVMGSSSDSNMSWSAALQSMNFEVISLRLRNLMMEDASETAEEELEMTDYDNPEDHILERKLDEDGSSSAGRGCSGACSRIMSHCGIGSRDWRKLRLTTLRMLITIIIGICIGLTGFAVSRTVGAMIHANIHIINDMMNADRPAAAFFILLIVSCIYTGFAALFVTFGSWQTRGSGVGRLNAYLSGMSSSKFLALKTLFVKIGGLILNVSAGMKQGMEGPFIHIGAMVGLHVSRFIIWILNLLFHRWGVTKYTQIVSGVVDERMFISGGAAAGFSVAFNAPIAGVLYVQDGAFAYWQGEYTIRTFLCTMTAVTTINMCLKDGDVLPSRGLIDIGSFQTATITLQEFWGFIILGILGGLMGIIFTKLNVTIEKFRQKYLAKLRLPNVLDVLACTVLTVLLSFILPFMLGCHSRSDNWCETNPDRCLQFHCGPSRYSDLATFFFTLPEETIRILFDRTPTPEAQIAYQVLIVFCIFYTLLACLSYGMAVPGGLFIPSIIIGASYGRLVGLAVQYFLPPSSDGGVIINPGVYAVLGSASMLGGITRMTLPISVMMIEITSDAQFLIPIMLVVLLAKVVADFGCGALYAEHLKLDGLVMVFGDRPPTALKKLLARDVMSGGSASGLRKLNVIESVETAWAAIKETRHNAFPVTDSNLATLRSIIQKRRQAHHGAMVPGAAAKQRRSMKGRRGSEQEESKSSALNSPHTSAASSTPISTVGTGVFLGLIQRRHLIYVLTSMPCFATSAAARDSEPMTALPYELALAAAANSASASASSSSNATAGRGQQDVHPAASALSSSGLSPDPSTGGLEIVPLNTGSSSPPTSTAPGTTTVSHALSTDAPVLNVEGASASASFVEWIARTSADVGQNLNAVAQGTVAPEQTIISPSSTLSRTPPSRQSPSPTHGTSSAQQQHESSIPILPSHQSQPLRLEHTSSGGTGPNGGHALGHDLTVQTAMLNHYVNLSPFIDQGAYTVSENISARRVWALFRSLGMRHIVVLNHQHQPVGVITRRDLIRFAVARK